jgi:hypothetical protein
MRAVPAVLVALALLTHSASVVAQSHALFTGVGTKPDVISSFDVSNETIDWEIPRVFPFANWMLFRAPAISGDGRFAVWPAVDPGFVGGIVVRDLSTGAMNGSPFPAPLPSLSHTDLIVSHPRRLIMYLPLSSGTMLILEPSEARLGTSCFRPFDATITLDGARMFIACDDRRILVFDTASESVIREFTLPNAAIRLKVNGDGSKLVTVSSGSPHWDLALRDAYTGEVLASEEVAGNPLFGLHSNADRTEIYASFAVPGPGFVQETRVHSFDSFARVATLPIAFHSMAFTADGTGAIGVSPIENPFGGLCRVVFVDAVARVLSGRAYTAYCGGPPNVTLVQPPLAPADVTVTVASDRVTLTWQLAAHSPAANRYAIDVSLVSGGPTVTTLTTPSDAMNVTFAGVPPGTYYVRLRAINAVGTSAPSVEQQVVVP